MSNECKYFERYLNVWNRKIRNEEEKKKKIKSLKNKDREKRLIDYHHDMAIIDNSVISENLYDSKT